MKIKYGFAAFFFIISLFHSNLSAQEDQAFTRADTLRGSLRPQRTCYDVNYYHIDVTVDPENKWIGGAVYIGFTAVRDFTELQIDLFENMEIIQISYGDEDLEYRREFGAVFVSFPETVKSGTETGIEISYAGNPLVAKRPPWIGGVVWTSDEEGNPFVSVTTQGTGASCWWPHKDHQADEPDSALISITVPPDFMDVSNGRLRSIEEQTNGWKKYNWFVSYPINDYNITFNIGKFEHFSDVYHGKENDLTLDYYVLPKNLEKAKVHFAEDVVPMMECFEEHFGEYPFIHDGYKLVESSHWGMEHQTAVAYGNAYKKGMFGRFRNEYAGKFDFIIVHETAHEWWGNNITSKDVADMWIHEGFGVYAEAVYVECRWGYEAMLSYINSKKPQVRNDRPVLGAYGVANEGSGDMYPKGALMLNTLRHVVNNDSLWWRAIKNLNYEFRYQTVTTEQIVDYFNRETNMNLKNVFDQYLRYSDIPTLVIKFEVTPDETILHYKWRADVKDFSMPIKIKTADKKFEFVHPTTDWQNISIGNMPKKSFKVDTDRFFVEVEEEK